MAHLAQIRSLVGVFAVFGAIGCYESHDLPPEPDPPMPGAPCSTERACAAGLSCVISSLFPGGYCSAECRDGCPEGSRCDRGYLDGICLATCEGDADCRPGYRCFADVCRPPCRRDEECGTSTATCVDGECRGAECTDDRDCMPGRACVGGRCVARPMDGGMELPSGAPCTRSSECLSRLCLPPDMGGVCAIPCTSRRDCAIGRPCAPTPIDTDDDSRPDLVVGACVAPDPAGRLLAGRCNSGAQCESRACVDRQCAELCVDAEVDCLPGHVCTTLSLDGVADPTFSGCGYTERGGAVAVDDLRVGAFTLTASGLDTRVNVAVPNDTVSVTFVASRASGDPVPIAYRALAAPNETSLFDLERLGAWEDQPIRWLPISNEEAATISVPSSTPDRVRVLGGRHGVRVVLLGDGPADPRAAAIDLTMRVKRAARVDRGTIDLDVYPVGIGFDAGDAPSEARLQNALGILRDIWSPAGLALGDVQYRDVPAGVVSRLSVVDSSDGAASELAELFRLSLGGRTDALPIFLVRSITASGRDGGMALGIAGGIPGPPQLLGTMHSGVVVSYDPAVIGSGSRGERNLAQVIAHESGHFLGLYHNRERLPPCPAGTGPTMADPCAPFGGEDVISDTSRRDGDNLMWWSLGGDTGRRFNVTLTEGQTFVLLRSPLVRR